MQIRETERKFRLSFSQIQTTTHMHVQLNFLVKLMPFLRRKHRYGLAANILIVSELFDRVAQDFFSKIQSPNHCLHSVLPEEKTSSLTLRVDISSSFPHVFIGFLNVLL